MKSADNEVKKAFGRNVRRLREKRSYTQLDLAAISKLNETQISKIETGENGPNFKTVLAIAYSLAVPPSELFKFDFDFKIHERSNLPKKRIPVGTTKIITNLIDSGFFDSQKTVADVISFCKSEFGKALRSADTSGALLRLVDEGALRKAKNKKSTKFSYYKIKGGQ